MAEPRHVCIIAHAHPEHSKGGGETAAWRQAEALRAAGWRVSFVAASPELGAQAARRPTPTVWRHGPDEYLYPFDGMTPDRLAWRDAGRRRALLDFLAGLGASAYHFHHYWRVGADLILALRKARPEARLVMTLHEMLAICLNHGQMVRTQGGELCEEARPLSCLGCFPEETIERLVIRRALLLQALRACDRFVYPSAFLRARYEAWGLPAARGLVLENPLSAAMMAAPRARADTPGIETRFAFFGQATPFKGLDLLLNAFALARAEQPGLHLTLNGASAEAVAALHPGLAPLIEELGPALAFGGRYRARDVLPLMRAAGWVVVPSRWWENSPMVIQEAKRAGTPLIVADVGGMAEKVRPGLDGLHFRFGSVADLARALLEAADPARRAAIAATLADATGPAEFLAAIAECYGGEG
ncbi:glycosyltransferase [Rubritepida flocculans]|uniref:glycosyltransferase n=1 Tax=Rubritepida flocculans TaxID=182403 RepID=UPI0004115B2C|nr:glycosyltransferase [Rubritepida flocculans]